MASSNVNGYATLELTPYIHNVILLFKIWLNCKTFPSVNNFFLWPPFSNLLCSFDFITLIARLSMCTIKQLTELHLRLFSIILGFYCCERDGNPILGTPANTHLKKRWLNSFGVNLDPQRITRIVYDTYSCM